ncbi:MAG: hypothetical protein Q9222_003598 [Ikaeria aurantiellina]
MRPTTSLSQLRENPDIWYRVQVLLHDLKNVGNDILSEKRLLTTTNELYISTPYFTEAEAAQILSAVVEPGSLSEESIDFPSSPPKATIQDTIHEGLASFFEKRKASGDSRPCGPHDMLPIYLDVFNLQRKDLQDEKFLGRVRRSGLGDPTPKSAESSTDATSRPTNVEKKGKKGKMGKKGKNGR